MSDQTYDIHARPIDTATYLAIEKLNKAVDNAVDAATLRWLCGFDPEMRPESARSISLVEAVEEEQARYRELSALEMELGFTAKDIAAGQDAVIEYMRSHCLACHALLGESLRPKSSGWGMCGACGDQRTSDNIAAMNRLFPNDRESEVNHGG